MATAAEYRAIILSARKEQLRMTAANVGRLLQTYTRAAESLAAQIRDVPSHMLTSGQAIKREYVRNLLADLDRAIVLMSDEYAGLLNESMLALAQQAAAREQRVGQMLGVRTDDRLEPLLSRSVALASGAQVSVQFGQVAEGAVRAVANRYYRDGLRLSDRLYRLNRETQQVVENTVVQGVAEQVSARELASRLTDHLAAAGSENPTYHAMRIARTEINNAHREAHIASTQTAAGTLKPYIQGVRWNLSMSHPAPDICDVYAEADMDGLGPGLYLPGSVPEDHPHGLCYTTSELAEFPGVGMGKVPDAAGVPRSQVNYYAGQGDAAASWAQAEAAAE